MNDQKMIRALLFFCLSVATACHALPPSIAFDSQVLTIVDGPTSPTAAISVYRATAEGIVYEVTRKRIKNPGLVWHSAKEGLVAVLKRKTMVLPLKVRSEDSDHFLLVDYAIARTAPDVAEYVVLKYYPSADGALVSVDVRIRHTGPSAAFVEHVRKERNRFVREFEKTESLLR